MENSGKTIQEIECLMGIKKRLFKLLGIASYVKDEISPLVTKIEKQSEFTSSLNKNVLILPSLLESVTLLKEELDSIKRSIQEENLKNSRDYELAIKQFQYLNEQISIAFKKKHNFRYVFLDLLSEPYSNFDSQLAKLFETSEISTEEEENILNLSKEVKDFIRRQSPVITNQLKKEKSLANETYFDRIIYPKQGERFDASLHELKIDDDGTIVKNIYQLGCNFPNYIKKALVTVRN